MPDFKKQNLGAWLNTDGNPIAMRDCEFESAPDANGKTTKKTSLFFSEDNQPSFLPNTHEDKDKKAIHAFTVGGKNYTSVTDYLDKATAGSTNEEKLWQALRSQYTQNKELRDALLKTDDKILVADFKDATINQDNLYGRLLMCLRDEIKTAADNHAKTHPTTALDWKTVTLPALPTTALDKWTTGSTDNTTANFTRVGDAVAAYDDEHKSVKAKKAQLLAAVAAAEQEAANARAAGKARPHYAKIEITVAKKKNAQGVEEEDIQINGNTTIITFDLNCPRASDPKNDKTQFTVERTFDPTTGSAHFSTKGVAKTFEDKVEIYATIAAMAANLEKNQLQQQQKSGQLLTVAEEGALASATKFISIEVELLEKEVRIPTNKRFIDVRGKRVDISSFQLTDKEAAALSGYLEHFDTVEMTLGNGNAHTFSAGSRAPTTTTVHLPGGAAPRSHAASVVPLSNDDSNASLSSRSFGSSS